MPAALTWNPNEPRRTAPDRVPGGTPAGGAPCRANGPFPELFSDRTGCRRAGRDHVLPDLVVRELGRQSGPPVRADRLSAGDLSAVRIARFGADCRRGRADAAGVPDCAPDRTDAGRPRRTAARAHARGARVLSR